MLQMEIGLNFLVGYWNGEGEYVDSPSAVAKHYVGSIFRFWFDITTSVPFSFIDYNVAMVSLQPQLSRIALAYMHLWTFYQLTKLCSPLYTYVKTA